MKYLILLVFFFCAACENTASSVARSLECEWVHKYKICICATTIGSQGYMTIAPNRVCNHIEMEPVEISPEKPTENNL